MPKILKSLIYANIKYDQKLFFWLDFNTENILNLDLMPTVITYNWSTAMGNVVVSMEIYLQAVQ